MLLSFRSHLCNPFAIGIVVVRILAYLKLSQVSTPDHGCRKKRALSTHRKFVGVCIFQNVKPKVLHGSILQEQGGRSEWIGLNLNSQL